MGRSFAEPSSSKGSKRARHGPSFASCKIDLDLLDCPICFQPFTLPIYQCQNGHTACSSCWEKLKTSPSPMCPSCNIPVIFQTRCLPIEKMLESIRISCVNADHGCQKSLQYNEKDTHEKRCIHSPSLCPFIDCSFQAPLQKLLQHVFEEHRDLVKVDAFLQMLDKSRQDVIIEEQVVRENFSDSSDDDVELAEATDKDSTKYSASQPNGKSPIVHNGFSTDDEKHNAEDLKLLKNSAQHSVPRRTVYSKHVTEELHKHFMENQYPDPQTREFLAQELGLNPKQVNKWFGNARWSLQHVSSSSRKGKSHGETPDKIRNSLRSSSRARRSTAT